MNLENKKSGFPYLVDICITKACPFGCKFCYTSSTQDGKHADVDRNLANLLFDANVLEVVFGGGEPTLNPNLEEILKIYKNLDFKIGVTTKNYSILNKAKGDYSWLFENCNSIAFSVNNEKEVTELFKNFEHYYTTRNQLSGYDYYTTNFYIQTIMGLQPYDKFLKLIKNCVSNLSYRLSGITLLGFKKWGFGLKNCKEYDVSETWFDDIKKIIDDSKMPIKLGIDSVIVEKYKDFLLAKDIPKEFLVAKEGAHTCFFDAVNYELRASSFTDSFVSISKDYIEYANSHLLVFQDKEENIFLQEFRKL